MSSDQNMSVDRLEFIAAENRSHVINNQLDRVIMQILLDSKRNDEPFRLLETSLFEPDMPVDRLDVEDSVVLRLAYSPREKTVH